MLAIIRLCRLELSILFGLKLGTCRSSSPGLMPFTSIRASARAFLGQSQSIIALWLLQAPPGIHSGVWSVVCAAVVAGGHGLGMPPPLGTVSGL